MDRRRVVVTGIGAVTPLGMNVDEYWANLLAGKSGIGDMTLCDPTGYSCRIAGEVNGLRPRPIRESQGGPAHGPFLPTGRGRRSHGG